MRSWIISDTHFYHKKICTYDDRPVDFTDRIILNWCRLVRDEDYVYHIGDVAFAKRTLLSQVIRRLTGRKALIRGNHDNESHDWYLRNGWDAVYDEFSVSTGTHPTVILSHVPHKFMTDDTNAINIHGHFHGQQVDRLREVEPDFVDRLTDRHYLFNIMHTNLSPVLLETAISSGLVKRTLVEIGAEV